MFSKKLKVPHIKKQPTNSRAFQAFGFLATMVRAIILQWNKIGTRENQGLIHAVMEEQKARKYCSPHLPLSVFMIQGYWAKMESVGVPR